MVAVPSGGMGDWAGLQWGRWGWGVGWVGSAIHDLRRAEWELWVDPRPRRETLLVLSGMLGTQAISLG